jgi:hypothetical protein
LTGQIKKILDDKIFHLFYDLILFLLNKQANIFPDCKVKQAGAELCQDQIKLGLAKLALAM